MAQQLPLSVYVPAYRGDETATYNNNRGPAAVQPQDHDENTNQSPLVSGEPLLKKRKRIGQDGGADVGGRDHGDGVV